MAKKKKSTIIKNAVKCIESHLDSLRVTTRSVQPEGNTITVKIPYCDSQHATGVRSVINTTMSKFGLKKDLDQDSSTGMEIRLVA